MAKALRCTRTASGAFEYYSTRFSDGVNKNGEPDVFNLTFNGFMAFVRDCKIAGPSLPSREIELIWVIVNTKDSNTAGEEVCELACVM